MIRILRTASRFLRSTHLTANNVPRNGIIPASRSERLFSSLERSKQLPTIKTNSLLSNPNVTSIANQIGQIRTVIKFSYKNGKRMTEKVVLQKFFRLHWGGWVRARCGKQKKLWKKSANLKRRLRQHVFCNAQQSTLLDKMVTNFWKRPKYYVDDPYTPYHTREEYWTTRKKPVEHS